MHFITSRVSKLVAGVAVVVMFNGCLSDTGGNQADSSDAGYPVKPLVIENDEEEGWGADIRLSIVEEAESDTAFVYKAVSTFEGAELGLIVTLPKSKGNSVFGEGIGLYSIGKQSDLLLRTLSKLYHLPVDTSATFKQEIVVNYADLGGLSKSLSQQPANDPNESSRDFKLFFAGKKETEYAELYLNVNAKEHWIEIREKDEEYRPALLKFFSK
jgi:hypothetical protein